MGVLGVMEDNIKMEFKELKCEGVKWISSLRIAFTGGLL
jgi:hypothetical protein